MQMALWISRSKRAAEEQLWALEQQPEACGISCKASHRKKGRDAILFGTSDITAGRLDSGNWQLRLSVNWSWTLEEPDFLPAFSGRSFQSLESPQQILACESSLLDAPCELRTKSAREHRNAATQTRSMRDLEDLRRDLEDLTRLTRLTRLTPVDCAACS